MPNASAVVVIKWTLVSTHSLIWRSWEDDEYVVYHPGTGDTHVLNSVSAEILSLLENQTRTTAELAELCAESFETVADDLFRRRVAESLEQFDELGLIEIAT